MTTMQQSTILAGMNGRFFPNNWRPATEEIAFAKTHGFQSLQFGGRETGLGEEELGDSFANVAQALQEANVTAVMEIVVRLTKAGVTKSGLSPLEILQVNLPAIRGLPCHSAHLHLVHVEPMSKAELSELEASFAPQFAQGVALAKEVGFRFGFEHNEVNLQSFFNNPESCRRLLEAVPDLHFVWDFNHTPAQHVPIYKSLIPRMSMLHISDTPLPETNYHLPLGQGNIDFEDYFSALNQADFDGAAILEIGGLPKSGGYGKDTDEALIASLHRLQMAINYTE